jgi:hypothetical protein
MEKLNNQISILCLSHVLEKIYDTLNSQKNLLLDINLWKLWFE